MWGRKFAFYALKRIGQLPLLILVVLTLNFLLIHLAPGDPLTIYIGPQGADPKVIADLRERFGLDQPLITQYFDYLIRTAHLDLGVSIRYREDVLELIARRVPATLLLAGSGLVVASLLGVFGGIAASRKRGSNFDRMSTMLAVTAQSMPAFLVGQLMLLAFGLNLGWFPVEGMQSLRNPPHGLAAGIDIANHMVLPVLTFAATYMALLFRLTRSKMIETLAMDYITCARAKGLRDRRIVFRHALPNASAPVITVVGLNAGLILASSIVIERVFSWPGLGQLMFDATSSRDYPLLLGLFAVSATMVLFIALVADVAQAALDPRIVLR